MFASTFSSAVSIYDEDISDSEMLECLSSVDPPSANSFYDHEIPDSDMLDILETVDKKEEKEEEEDGDDGEFQGDEEKEKDGEEEDEEDVDDDEDESEKKGGEKEEEKGKGKEDEKEEPSTNQYTNPNLFRPIPPLPLIHSKRFPDGSPKHPVFPFASQSSHTQTPSYP
ncbi:MAG: hypothetical protein HETSPECPRED_007310 [Heterodermia speciosa]|uniref:Uncharacterized protein n=1 Tax=Heterodermia speciosa TaxID=116794 RepID=A0A8H3FSJ7_9LECA|nr:MAG: hypothetical protein HETSPECPRED_007310 [Heterodermia speciosa]